MLNKKHTRWIDIMKTEERNKIGCQTPKSTIKREIMSTFIQSSNSELCKRKIIVATAELIWHGKRTHLTT